MNVPSGVRSAIYTAVPLVSAIVIVLSTNPVTITCALGLSIGVGILASLNGLVPAESGIPIQTSSNSSLPEGKEADSYTDAADAVPTTGWTNYPKTPTTETWPDAPATEWQPPVPGCAEGYEPEPPPLDRSWVETEYIKEGPLFSPGGWTRRDAPRKSRVSEIPSVVGASRYDTDKIKALEDWCNRVPPNPPVYEPGWKS